MAAGRGRARSQKAKLNSQTPPTRLRVFDPGLLKERGGAGRDGELVTDSRVRSRPILIGRHARSRFAARRHITAADRTGLWFERGLWTQAALCEPSVYGLV